MVAEVYAGLSAIKTAFDLARGLKEINDATVRNAAIIELQEKILSAQSEQAKLIDRIRERDREIARLNDWKMEKDRYQLERLPPGAFVYSLKPEMANGEPSHAICPTCYQRGKKSILSWEGPSAGTQHVRCYECGTVLDVDHSPSRPTERGLRSDYDPYEKFRGY